MLGAILARLGVDPRIRWMAVLAWIANPLAFSLSFTFMTEVPFLCVIALGALCLLVVYLPGSFLVRAAWRRLSRD